MKIEIEIPAATIANLMVTAIESGDPVTTASRGGWCDGIYWKSKGCPVPKGASVNGEPWYANPALYDASGFQIEVVEVDDETTGHTTGHVITRPNLLAGLKVMAEKFPVQFSDLLNDNVDAPTADIFLQCVCFGEERYA
jgi:hypothetical protein